MPALKYTIIKTAFEFFSFFQLPKIIRRFSSCKGIIFTLHRVLPDSVAPFQPNAILQITPDFLESVIIKIRASGFDIVSFDEAVKRIKSPKKSRPFIVFTFDDAYKDNLKYALPILKKHKCPFTLFVPTAFIDGKGELWWQVLEDIVRDNDKVVFDEIEYRTKTKAQKEKSYEIIYWQMRDMNEEERIKKTQNFATYYNIDMSKHCKCLILDWKELQIFADEPLCTIGAHTVNHYELAKLSKKDACLEVKQSADMLEERFKIRPQYFSYPIGALRSADEREYDIIKQQGFKAAVTTLPGGLYFKHKDSLNYLPRVSLNGYFQKNRYLEVFLTGAIFGR